jgi:hypothetical protein
MKRLLTSFLALIVAFTALAPVVAKAETESASAIEFFGQLIELSSTDVPTTIIVRDFVDDADSGAGWTDYTVDIDAETKFGRGSADSTVMSDWITGDWLRVKGTINNNTQMVTADLVVNSSINPFNHRGLNGWITEIGDDSMTVQWAGVEHEVKVTENTRMVVPPINPASLSDFEVGDRVRLRLVKGSENEARIIVALRRGDHIYLKARTRGFWVTLNDIDEDGDESGSLEVTLRANPHLRAGDVNNLVGVEGDELTVTYDENTVFVRRFMGRTTIDEFLAGDTLFVVGRVNDDGTISARLIKDVNIWALGVARHTGTVEKIDTSDDQIVVEPEGDGDITQVVVNYGADTKFIIDGEEGDEDDVEIGDTIRVRGVARRDGDTLTISSVETVWIESD